MLKLRLLHEVRAVKNKKELLNIIQAQRISEEVLKYLVANLRTGISELEAERIIIREFKKQGVNILAFSPIVAFGKNTANIHHIPGKTKLKEGDIIMFDFGATVNHYCSDMTRTFFWGEPTSKQVRIYVTVLNAQEKAINKILSGERRAKLIDASARKFIGKKFRNNFKHGLGHGVGTVIHEWPNLKPNSEDVLPAGCVMTVEPGVYLKGFGGVRIEDMVLVTKSGGRILTNFPKDLKSAILKIR